MRIDRFSLRRRRIIGAAGAAIFVGVLGLAIHAKGIKDVREGRETYYIPVEELYQLVDLHAPDAQPCLLGDLCAVVSVNALSADAAQIGGGIKQAEMLQRLTEVQNQPSLGKTRLMELLPSEHQNLDTDGTPYMDVFVALISAEDKIEIDNIVGIACHRTHCFAELGPVQDLGKRKAHIMVAFDRGRLLEWPTLAQLVLRCIQQQCRKFR